MLISQLNISNENFIDICKIIKLPMSFENVTTLVERII